MHASYRVIDRGGYLWWMKELRQVKTSSGTMAHSVITLLNFDCSTLRVSTPSKLMLPVGGGGVAADGSLSRLVKY